jgi:hypothetical protein
MSETIKDGMGDGYQARVSANHQLRTVSVSLSEVADASAKGNSYNINTGIIPLTTSTESGVLYFKNEESPINGESDIVIDAIAVGIDNLGTTSGASHITVIRNPSSVSFSTAVDMNQNRNFGSSNTLDSTVYKGAEGATITGGDDIALFFQNAGTRGYYTVDLELSKGSSIAVKIDTQTTAGTTNIYAAFILHRKDGNNK